MINFFIYLYQNKTKTIGLVDCLKSYGKKGLAKLSDGFDHTNAKVFELYYNYINNTDKLTFDNQHLIILDKIKKEFLECLKQPCSDQTDCNSVYETGNVRCLKDGQELNLIPREVLKDPKKSGFCGVV